MKYRYTVGDSLIAVLIHRLIRVTLGLTVLGPWAPGIAGVADG